MIAVSIALVIWTAGLSWKINRTEKKEVEFYGQQNPFSDGAERKV